MGGSKNKSPAQKQ